MLNSLTLLRAMNGIHEEDVIMAENRFFDEKQVKHVNTKRIITFALAAALILGLGAVAYAIYRATMYTRIPEEGTTAYHVLYNADPSAPPEMLHVNFDRTKMAFRSDVPPDGCFPVMRASDLPGAAENWEKTSLHSMLYVAQRFGLPWEMKQRRPDEVEIDPKQEPDELLKEAGMDAETAKTWFTGYEYRDTKRNVAGDNMDIIRIELYGGYRLHGQEVILGAFSPDGAEVRSVREGTLGEYQMVEVQMLQASGAIDNHLFLFHPEKYYLLQISGNGIYYDFPVLEQIGQNIEVTETNLHVDSYENKVNFILADLAAG
ncbi:MAG: hypothetical protein K6C12_08580 [Oscillospiraceae bacterium]|nr:hypothetical protein [Oscillospiraceae bacterium]